MKYNRPQIMQAAWRKHRRFCLTFAQALRLAWAEARMAALRYNVYGQRIGWDTPVKIASGVDDRRAAELEWLHKCTYDRVWRTIAA